MRKKSRISIWFLLAGAILGIAAFFISLLVIWALKPGEGFYPRPTAIVTVISAPTSTPLPLTEMLGTPTGQPTEEVIIDGIGRGLYVQISGTGGDGLRLRTDASTKAEIRFLGYESEVFLVTDGPKNADGYIWWYLTAPYDETRSGWAVSSFIRPIQIQP